MLQTSSDGPGRVRSGPKPSPNPSSCWVQVRAKPSLRTRLGLFSENHVISVQNLLAISLAIRI